MPRATQELTQATPHQIIPNGQTRDCRVPCGLFMCLLEFSFPSIIEKGSFRPVINFIGVLTFFWLSGCHWHRRSEFGPKKLWKDPTGVVLNILAEASLSPRSHQRVCPLAPSREKRGRPYFKPFATQGVPNIKKQAQTKPTGKGNGPGEEKEGTDVTRMPKNYLLSLILLLSIKIVFFKKISCSGDGGRGARSPLIQCCQ